LIIVVLHYLISIKKLKIREIADKHLREGYGDSSGYIPQNDMYVYYQNEIDDILSYVDDLDSRVLDDIKAQRTEAQNNIVENQTRANLEDIESVSERIGNSGVNDRVINTITTGAKEKLTLRQRIKNKAEWAYENLPKYTGEYGVLRKELSQFMSDYAIALLTKANNLLTEYNKGKKIC
jgi:hypothetical protein